MNASIVTVTSKGQITLPVSMREAARIEEGDTLLIIESDKQLVLKKVTKDDFSDIKAHASKSMAKFWSDPRDDIYQR